MSVRGGEEGRMNVRGGEEGRMNVWGVRKEE